MKKYSILFVTLLALGASVHAAQKKTSFDVHSPNGAITVHIEAGAKLLWSVQLKGRQIIAPSPIALHLDGGDVLGDNAVVTSSPTRAVDTTFTAINYKKTLVRDIFNELTLTCKNGYSVIFRVYDEAAAYRFETKRKGDIIVRNEEASFTFTHDDSAFVPFMEDYRQNKIFNSSFESHYRESTISKYSPDSLAFLPMLVDAGGNTKAVILEADLEDYPGMFLKVNDARNGFTAVYAPCPLETERSGYSGMNSIPTKRADYIAKTNGSRSFPWRVVVLSGHDKDLLDNDIVQKLASPSRLADCSWIVPGQVAWDWWNDWNVSHVAFKAGINTETYKYYIDFAAANHIRYIIMDEGWSPRTDMLKQTPVINLQEIIDHGKQKGVDIILWALWINVTAQMKEAFPLYAKMGVKGFKIDFIDRDDQQAVASVYEIARKAAEYHLLVDYHGVSKPTGLQRTYPNVIGYEGVKGLENMKWGTNVEQPRYDVSIPFLRMMAGPMDYTPGAMRNATKASYRPVNSMPMSQGTRCHQLAMYVVFEAPLQMLSDNPTAYTKEQECTDFITHVPTTYDETKAIDGRVGEFAAIARRKGSTWFVGAMTNWTARDITFDCSFLGAGEYEAVVFKDGINADRDAADYTKDTVKLASTEKVTIHLAPGGGWAARITKVR